MASNHVFTDTIGQQPSLGGLGCELLHCRLCPR